jgi:hypothetical protein
MPLDCQLGVVGTTSIPATPISYKCTDMDSTEACSLARPMAESILTWYSLDKMC